MRATNGIANGSPTSVAIRKRAAPRPAQAKGTGPEAASPRLASFVAVETQAVDAPMWPVHALAWLQPELAPARPCASGLRVERRYKVPAPDFLHATVTAAGRPHALEQACRPLDPKLRPAAPESDLAPLGWDPRVLCFPVVSTAPPSRLRKKGDRQPFPPPRVAYIQASAEAEKVSVPFFPQPARDEPGGNQ